MAEKLLARWDDFSGGIGYLYSPGGVAWGEGWIGGRGYLSPMGATSAFSDVIDSGYIIRHGFVEKDSDGDPHLYLLTDNGTDGKIYKTDLTTATHGTDQGVTSYAGKLLGHPARYRGNWYYSEIGGSLMRKLTTCHSGAIGSDTLTDGDAGSGDGHLINYGHQLAKIQETDGISILKTDGDANVNADWGSDFPCGDSSDVAVGGASVRGLAYVQRGRGLYTFNDRGRAGSVFEDFAAWQLSDVKYWSTTDWKGGVVFTRLDSIYYWNPNTGNLPVDISVGAKNQADDKVNLTNLSSIRYRAVSAVGNYLYVSYDVGATGTGIMVGESKGDPTQLAWWVAYEELLAGGMPSSCRPVVVTDSQAPSASSATTLLVYQSSATAFRYLVLNVDGSPLVGTAEKLYIDATVHLPYIQLEGDTPTKIRIHVEGLESVLLTPSVRPVIEVYGDRFISTTAHPKIGTIRQSGISEFNMRHAAGLNDRLAIHLKYIAEAAVQQTTPPAIRWIEVYGEA